MREVKTVFGKIIALRPSESVRPASLGTAGPDQIQKFDACALICLKNPGHTACEHFRILLLYAAHHHAHMLAFHHDADSLRFQDLKESPLDLDGQPLLH